MAWSHAEIVVRAANVVRDGWGSQSRERGAYCREVKAVNWEEEIVAAAVAVAVVAGGVVLS